MLIREGVAETAPGRHEVGGCEAGGDVFEGWIDGLSAVLIAGGIPDEHARPPALQWLSLLEGVFIFCRASRRTEPLATAGVAAAALVRTAQQLAPDQRSPGVCS